MLVIAGTLTFDPSMRDAVVNAAAAVMAETRKEEGCIDYRFSLDLDTDGRLHVFEHWQGDDVWQVHMATPHVAAFGSAVAAAMKGAEVQRYEVTAFGPLFPEGEAS